MGLFSMRRHRLQNKANRITIQNDRKAKQAEAAAAREKRQRDLSLGRIIMEENEKVANRTQEERAQELDHFAEWNLARGNDADAQMMRDAAEVVRAMTPAEYAEDVQAQLRHDPAAGARMLARRKATG